MRNRLLKKTVLFMTLTFSLGVIVACGKEEEKTTAATTEATTVATTEATTAAATEATTEASTEAASDSKDSDKYDGSYYESVAGRGVISISHDSDGMYFVEVSWSSSAATNSEWSFHGNFDENGVMEYYNCIKVNNTFDEDGNKDSVEQYNTGSGKLKYADGKLTWQDDQENIAEEAEFIKN